MSLFEKLNNKRYDLQEAIDDKGNITPEPGEKAIEKSIVRNIKKKQVRLNKNQKKIINTNKKEGEKLLQKINKNSKPPSGEKPKIEAGKTTYSKNKKSNLEVSAKRSRETLRADRIKSMYDADGGVGDSNVGDMTQNKSPVKTTKPVKTTTPVKITGNVDSKKAELYTKKINAANPKRPEYVKKDVYKGAEEITKKINPKQSRPLGQLVKKTKPSKTSVSGKLTPGQIDFSKSAELASKRKARINPKTGKATQAGVKDFAMNRSGFGRRSANMSQSDFKKMVTGDPKTAKSFKKVVTDAERIASNPQSKAYKDIEKKINTSDYAGKEARKRPAGSKTYAQVKREIDAKEKAYQTKTLPKKQKLAKKFLVNPQKRDAVIKRVGSQNVAFKQTATKFASQVPGGKSTVAKKVIKGLSKIGPAGRIAAATGLVLLNPGARKLAKNIGRTALGFTGGGKTPVKQQTTRMGINLSPGSSTASSKYSLKRQELLRKNPNKVTNKNLA